MWDSRRLTTSKTCYRDNFTFTLPWLGYTKLGSDISFIPDVLVTLSWPSEIAFWFFLHIRRCGLHLHKSTLWNYLVKFLAQWVLPPLMDIMKFGSDISLSLKALLYSLQYILWAVIEPNVMFMPYFSCDCGTIHIMWIHFILSSWRQQKCYIIPTCSRNVVLYFTFLCFRILSGFDQGRNGIRSS
jgi:hypothetical protein